MRYVIKITRVEKCYVEADNYNEAIDKARFGDCDCIATVQVHYEDIEEGDEDSG
jgi:hypothetical protein